MSPVTTFEVFILIYSSPMSPVEFKKRLCRHVKFKGQGGNMETSMYYLFYVWLNKGI